MYVAEANKRLKLVLLLQLNTDGMRHAIVPSMISGLMGCEKRVEEFWLISADSWETRVRGFGLGFGCQVIVLVDAGKGVRGRS